MWEDILKNNDKAGAQKLIDQMGTPEQFEKNAALIGYPKGNIWMSGHVNRHLVRVLNDIKILAIFGETL